MNEIDTRRFVAIEDTGRVYYARYDFEHMWELRSGLVSPDVARHMLAQVAAFLPQRLQKGYVPSAENAAAVDPSLAALHFETAGHGARDVYYVLRSAPAQLQLLHSYLLNVSGTFPRVSTSGEFVWVYGLRGPAAIPKGVPIHRMTLDELTRHPTLRAAVASPGRPQRGGGSTAAERAMSDLPGGGFILRVDDQYWRVAIVHNQSGRVVK